MLDLTQHRIGGRSAYPERFLPRESWWDRQGARLASPLLRALKQRAALNSNIIESVRAKGSRLTGLNDHQLRFEAQAVRDELRLTGFSRELVCRAFALVREAADRTIGQRHHDVQVLGGWVLLNGCVAEMETGEGKTLTATLAAATAALAGVPVHVITVNDYLAARDAEKMEPIYRLLGLTVGTITNAMPPGARQAVYASDVTYCTNKELVFDYLRDRLVLGQQPNRIQLQLEQLYGQPSRLRKLVLRGLCFGIVDEADSVMVDEARVPLIIAGNAGQVLDHSIYETALALARSFQPEREFTINRQDRRIHLLPAGREKLAAHAKNLTGLWAGPRRREGLVCQALTALHLFQRDTHYLVDNGKVHIVDENTGRLMAERAWEDGLHQMIELKEGCPLTPMQASLARITYQRFFRRYLWLSGMTGTAREISSELWQVYRLATVTIPTHRPVQRRRVGDQLYATAEEKWEAVVRRITDLQQRGVPVLVGTRSVRASEELSERLRRAVVQHEVLNARQDKSEAELVALAGLAGRVTVATNMAGRGTDIQLPPDVAHAGGLHVLATERHESQRIDRQLYGRCGRQGDPGQYETVCSLEDDLFVSARGRVWGWFVRRLVRPGRPLEGWLARWLVRHMQRSAEALHAQARQDLLQHEERLETSLAFSGRAE